MFFTSLKIACRSLYKKKAYTLLNLFGLVIGMTSCLLIFHYVAYERSYDERTGKDAVYRVQIDTYSQKKPVEKFAAIPPALAPMFKREFPEVESYCRLYEAELLFENPKNNAHFLEKKGYFAEPAFIDYFHTEFIAGHAATALREPNTVIISEKLAKKYFGSEPAVGKVFPAARMPALTVTGVFREHPANSHLKIDFLVSFSTFSRFAKAYDPSLDTETHFGWYTFYTYLKLRRGTDIKKFEAALPAFSRKYMAPDEPGNDPVNISLMRTDDIYLNSDRNFELSVMGNGRMVSFMFGIALLVIGIAWINYINLATARSTERAKEVGIKKVLGASRSTLLRYFFLESFLLNLLALGVSLTLFVALLPQFDLFSGKEAYTGISMSAAYWLLFLAIFVAGTALSAFYPAVFLSSFKPAKVLKGAYRSSLQGQGLRRVLIVAQFAVSIVLIAGTLVVYRQVQFMRQQDLGVNIDHTIVLKGPSYKETKGYTAVYASFKSELLRLAGVQRVAASSEVPGAELYWNCGVRHPGTENNRLVDVIVADADFVPAYGLKLLAGRNFRNVHDENTILLNESAMSLLGMRPSEVIGRRLVLDNKDTVSVTGLIRNFHQEGLQQQIRPLLVRLRADVNGYYSIRISTSHPQSMIGAITKVWQTHFPAYPFDHFFMDERFNQQYKADLLFGRVFGTFAILAIIIALCGLLGLTSYAVLQRMKEISIRKVLGAGSRNILLLLNKDFMKLILLAFLIAVPLAWYVMHQWLQDYAYRISLSADLFLASGAVALLLAFVTITIQSLKAALANPVKNLRTE